MTSRLLRAVAAAILVLIILLTGICRGEERQRERAAEIVAAVLKAYGGADALRKIVSVAATGEITERLTGKKGSYARYLERPGKLRIEVRPEQGGEIRILKGTRGWRGGGGGFEPASPLELQAMRYQYSYLDLPMGLTGNEYRVTYGGKERLNGRDVDLLLIEPPHAPTLHVLIDAATHLIARVSASFTMGMMGSGELATEYHDYHTVDGVPFPFRLVNFAGDITLSEITLREITLNRKLRPDLFSPP